MNSKVSAGLALEVKRANVDNSPSIPSMDAASWVRVCYNCRPHVECTMRRSLEAIQGGGGGQVGIEIDCYVSTGVSSYWGLGTAGWSEVIDMDWVCLIEAL